MTNNGTIETDAPLISLEILKLHIALMLFLLNIIHIVLTGFRTYW